MKCTACTTSTTRHVPTSAVMFPLCPLTCVSPPPSPLRPRARHPPPPRAPFSCAQNHVGLHGGRTYGHAVSKDLTHWAHMPISIWNDQFYDSSAIYTGSATIVGGQVVQVYPGLCKKGVDGCPGGTNLCIAKPADPTDRLQTNWTKDAAVTGAVNPIVNATGRDPTTAWQVPETGEWRLSTFDTIIYGSMDFKSWCVVTARRRACCALLLAAPALR